MTEVGKPMWKEHILIFEPLSGGHRAEFLSHLLEHIRRVEPSDRTYTFVVGAQMSDEEALPSCVSVRETTPAQRKALDRARGSLGGFVFWRVLQSYLRELKPNHLIIMDLTWLELPLCFRKLPCTFSGILFIQYPELRSAVKYGWRRWLKFWLKDMKTHRFLHNRMLRRIYLLNGAYSCNFLNHRFGVSCYSPIPDPVPEVSAEPGFQVRCELGIEEHRRLFLFFGSMSARKGVDVLVDAIGSLAQDAARKSAFVFFGIPEADYADRYHQLLKTLADKRPDVCLHFDEHFVSSARMRALFEQVDWILIPYTRPEYSSGILAHAAASKTPVIGPAAGLIGRQIREHGLGLGVDVHSDTLRHAIEGAVVKEHVFDETARQAFVAASTPERFAATLLGM